MMNNNDEFEKMIHDYENAPVPAEGVKNLKRTIERERSRRRARRGWINTFASAAAALAILVAVPNLSASAAETLGGLPVVGGFFRVVTFRQYSYESAHFHADVTVPKLVSENCGDAVRAINADVDATADALTAEFETLTTETMMSTTNAPTGAVAESANADSQDESAGPYAELYVNSETVCDTDNWFTLKVILYQGAGSGYQRYKFYNIDKNSAKWVQLSDLFKTNSGWQDVVSDSIKEQMRARMAADDCVTYWLDSEVPDWDFKSVDEAQNFYVNQDGEIVIVFDEYAVAPGAMGTPEFAIPAEVVAPLLADGVRF